MARGTPGKCNSMCITCFHTQSESYWTKTSDISLYTLSDLGDLSNLIGLRSQTIQQYSPPSEWIMCELGVFPIFLENDLLKLGKIILDKIIEYQLSIINHVF